MKKGEVVLFGFYVILFFIINNMYQNYCIYNHKIMCPVEIILFGMTYYHHWFEEFRVNFFQMKFHYRIYLIVWIVRSSHILLNCVSPFELRLS